MSTKEKIDTDINVKPLSSKSNPNENQRSTGLHQSLFKYSYSHVLVLLIVLCGLLVSVSHFLYSEHKKSNQTVINALATTQASLNLQHNLLASLALSESMLNANNIAEYLSYQKKLIQVNKQLSLSKTKQQSIYQEWVIKSQSQINSLRRIALNDEALQIIGNSVVTELLALDREIAEWQSREQDAFILNGLLELSIKNKQLLAAIESLAINDATKPLEQVTSTVADIEEIFLSIQTYSSLSSEGAVNLANQRLSLIKSSLFRDGGFTELWQENVQRLSEYNQQIAMQSSALKSILFAEAAPSPELIAESAELKLRLMLLLAISLFLLVCVFGYVIWHFKRHLAMCAKKYQQQKLFDTEANESRVSQHEAELNAVIQRLVGQQEKLKAEMELVEYTAASQRNTQVITEQRNYAMLCDLAVKQSEHLALSSLSIDKSVQKSHLFQVYLFGRSLATELHQARFHRYIQADDMILTLSDVDLISTAEAILLNQSSIISQQGNELLLCVDGNISPQVRIDVDVFTETLTVFSQLLTNDLNDSQLEVSLKLQDKNSGQQQILFVGKVNSDQKIQALPSLLQKILEQEGSTSKSEIVNYFFGLLKYLHGDNVSIHLIDQGYQFSFTLPFAVMLNRPFGDDIAIKLASKDPGLSIDEHGVEHSFYPRPIDVLVGVNSPSQYYRLRSLLQAAGLQVTFVAQASRQHKYWQSGRYAILITEFTLSPFINFSYEEKSCGKDSLSLPRGVFALNKSLAVRGIDKAFSHWIVEDFISTNSLTQLSEQLSPWLKQQSQEVIDKDIGAYTRDDVPVSENTTSAAGTINESDVFLGDSIEQLENTNVVDLARFIDNQGSAELAFYMLDEYIADNHGLAEQLTVALQHHDLSQALSLVAAMEQNSRILAAGDLLKLCQDWQKLLADPVLSKNKGFLAKLLSKTKQEIGQIEAFSKAM